MLFVVVSKIKYTDIDPVGEKIDQIDDGDD